MSAAPSKGCRICGGTDLETLTETIRGDTPAHVTRCTNCGTATLPDEFFEPQTVEEQYRSDYQYTPSVDALLDSPVDPYRRKVEKIAAYLDPETTSLFEVGAGPGFFLRVAKERVRRVLGLELNRAQADFCTEAYGVEMVSEPLETLDLDERFDVVCAMQVLEHVPDPEAFLINLLRFVKPGGILYIDVPNVYEPLLSLYKIDGFEKVYFRKTHLFNFSREGLETLLRNIGLTDFETSFDQYYSLTNHLHWGMTGRGQKGLTEGYRFLPPMPLDDSLPVGRELAAFFERVEAEYERILEANEYADTLVAVVRVPGPTEAR